jgi:hypothetical protein
MDPERRLSIENELRRRLIALGPPARRSVLGILSLPEEERAARISDFYADARLRPLAELLMDLEANDAVRDMLTVELRGMEPGD